jgi:two-component system OmpR family response regulator
MGRRILVIDDEVDFFILIQNYLSKRDYTLTPAYTLAEGYKLLEEQTFDVLLLDNNLPDGVGWKQAPAIQKKYPKMRITLISAFESIFIVNTMEGAPFRIMEKPVSLSAIENYF